jgi:hypothetical protein
MKFEPNAMPREYFSQLKLFRSMPRRNSGFHTFGTLRCAIDHTRQQDTVIIGTLEY